MLGASVALLSEGVQRGAASTPSGRALAGVVAIVVVRRYLHRHERLELGALRGADALKGFVIIAVMTAHSFAEGVGVGVAFGGGEALGVFIAVAIALHNVPEGFAISLTLVPRGASVWAAAAWSVFSSLPQLLVAVPAFVFVETFGAVLPAGLGFAAGAMVWMVLRELLPEARAAASPLETAAWGVLAFTAMIAFQVMLGTL